MTFKEKLTALSPQARLTIMLHGVFTLAESMGEVFMNLFLWRATGSLRLVAYYNLSYWGVLLLVFILIGYLFRGKGMSVVFRISFLLHFLFFMSVVVLGEAAPNYAVWLGVFGGAAAAFYWAAHEVMVVTGTNDRLRELFYGVQGSLGALVRIVGPVVAGAIIWSGGQVGGELSGYFMAFGVLALVFFVSELLIYKTKSVSFEQFNLSGVFELYRTKRIWRLNLWRSFLDGAMITRWFLWGVLSYVILQNELWLGAVMGIVGGLGIVTNSLVGHLFTAKRRMLWNSIGMGLLVVAGVLYPLLMNGWGLLIDQVAGEAIGYPLFAFAWLAFFFLAIDSDRQGKKRQYEYLVGHEIWQGAGRLLSIGLFILLLHDITQVEGARWWFGGLSLLYVPIWFLVGRIQKEAVLLRVAEE